MLAVVRALRFHERDTRDLECIPESAWPRLLDETDRAHLTPALGVRCRDMLPAMARARVERNLADNAARYERLAAAHRQITDALSLRKIEFAVLKGFSLWPYYSDDWRHRPQYDIDIYIPPESGADAAATVRMLGYEAVHAGRDPGADICR
jgi:hypothetical protein